MEKMYQHRIDNFFKHDVLLKEHYLDPESFSINVPRHISLGTERTWTNTVKLLEYLAQFALSGSMSAWLVREGKILKYAIVEPKSDKAIVRNFIKGQKLSAESGKEKEALKALTKVIEQYDSHAQAYERRGYVNFELGKFSDALYDFNKCISYDDSIPAAYYCKALISMQKEDYQTAVGDLILTTQKAIALQPIYWKARLLKGQCHLMLQEYAEAAQEFKLFTARAFPKDDPNIGKRKEAFFKHAQALVALKEYGKAMDVLESADKIVDKGDKALNDNIASLIGELKERLRTPASAK
jgi:tetratricopeptide (TPR) repeat protein